MPLQSLLPPLPLILMLRLNYSKATWTMSTSISFEMNPRLVDWG